MQDKIIKVLANNGRILITLALTTQIAEKSRQTHDLSPLATAAMGRLLTVGIMMSADLKNAKDKLTLQVKGGGPIGVMIVTANSNSEIKGYVGNSLVDLPLNEFGKLDVGGAVGTIGFLNVIKDIGLKEPYVGISNLVSGEIGDDFANYFVNSEQKRSAVAVGVLVNKDGVKSSGGYLINAMPDATSEEISKLEKNIYEAGAISKMLDSGMTLIEIAKKITGDENVRVIKDDVTPKYLCDCSKENMEKGLISLGKDELKDILKTDKKVNIKCHFCNKEYNFSEADLIEILAEINKI